MLLLVAVVDRSLIVEVRDSAKYFGSLEFQARVVDENKNVGIFV